MEIKIQLIPEQGLNFLFSDHDAWVKNNIETAMQEILIGEPKIDGHISVFKTGSNISVNGNCSIHFQADCNRCLCRFEDVLDFPMIRHLIPKHDARMKVATADGDETLELADEDMHFSYYENESINLGKILKEETVLVLPIKVVCQENCKGLCVNCGVNLNQTQCACDLDDALSPFQVLKNFPIKK